MLIPGDGNLIIQMDTEAKIEKIKNRVRNAFQVLTRKKKLVIILKTERTLFFISVRNE